MFAEGYSDVLRVNCKKIMKDTAQEELGLALLNLSNHKEIKTLNEHFTQLKMARVKHLTDISQVPKYFYCQPTCVTWQI